MWSSKSVNTESDSRFSADEKKIMLCFSLAPKQKEKEVLGFLRKPLKLIRVSEASPKGRIFWIKENNFRWISILNYLLPVKSAFTHLRFSAKPAAQLKPTSVAKTQLGLQFLEGYLKLYRKGFSKTASSASASSTCTVVLERIQEQGTGQDTSLGNSPSYMRKFNRTVHIASHVRSPHTSSADLGIRVLNF